MITGTRAGASWSCHWLFGMYTVGPARGCHELRVACNPAPHLGRAWLVSADLPIDPRASPARVALRDLPYTLTSVFDQDAEPTFAGSWPWPGPHP